MSIARSETTFSPERPSAGQSEEFRQNLLAERQATSHAQEPISKGGWKRELYDKAMDVYLECSFIGWDGYDASPLTIEAIEQISPLIDSLPEWVQKPDIIPTSDGELSMEWHSSGNRILSVIPKGEIFIYAASLEPMNNQYGRAPLVRKWPENIILILRDYFKSGTIS